MPVIHCRHGLIRLDAAHELIVELRNEIFASVAASGGQSLVVIGKLLGHSQPATTARYAHLADDPVKAASDAVGKHIAAAMDGGKGGEVVDLPRSRRAAPKPNG